jgi:hypothetical protein
VTIVGDVAGESPRLRSRHPAEPPAGGAASSAFSYHARMQQRGGSRDVALVVATLAAFGPFVSDAALWTATALTALVAVAATAGLLGEPRPWRWPVDRLILPAFGAFAAVGTARLLDPVPWLAVVVVAAFAVLAWAVGLETAPAAPGQAPGSSLADGSHARATSARLATLGLAFLAFAAIGGIVPAGAAGEEQSTSLAAFLAAIVLDVAIGALAGYRIVALAPHDRGDALLAVYLYSLAIAPIAVLLRVLALPRLFGPAELTLVLYLVTSLRESHEPIRRNARLLEETAILAVVGVAIAAAGLLTR